MKLLSCVFILCSFAVCSNADSEPLFDVIIVPSITDKELDLWFYTPSEHGPKIPTVKTVYQEQMFSLLMFSRVEPVDSQTEIDITYDLKVFSPSNTLSIDEKDIKYYKGEPVPSFLIPNSVLDIGFDKEEAFGKYRIEAVFTEHVSGRKYTRTSEVELIPFVRPKPFTSKEEYSDWIMNYYSRPNPVQSFAAILYCVETDNKWIEENYMSLAFHRRIFLDNPFLWEYYARMYETASEAEKKKMLLVAAIVPSDEKEKLFVPKIEASLMQLYKDFLKVRIPDTDKDLTTGVQLDILWAEFFATGKYQPIKRLVSSLALQKYEGILDKIKNKEIKELTEETEKQVMLEAVYRSAVWSLVSNCTGYDLVHEYCKTIYERESLSPEVKKSLGMVLAMVDIKKQDQEKKKGD